MSITIYSMVFNEELIIKLFIDHYRERFSNCRIVIYDNESTDNTAKIALENACEVIPYYTNNQVDDEKLRNLKNNCWKNATTDWVLVADSDELLEITENELKNEDANGTTIIKSEAYNMINMENNSNLDNIKYGTRCTAYDKDLLFKKAVIQEINYVHGGHHTSPIGQNKPSSKKYILYHYNCISPEIHFKKFKYTKERLSEINKRHGWGVQYNRDVSLEEIQSWFDNARSYATKIR